MKKVLKWIAGTLAGLVAVLLVAWLVVNEPLPQGEAGPAADSLALRMLRAVGADGLDGIKTISWQYTKSKHQYQWDYQANMVQVVWEGYWVAFSPDTFDGEARLGERRLDGEEAEQAIQQAWSYFANDSFWLMAPFKVFDPGTERRVVQTERGEALLVTYTSGGVTPGDSYLWILDETGRPVAWKLWVSIIPIGGVEFSWEGWQQHLGVWWATEHNGLTRVWMHELKVE